MGEFVVTRFSVKGEYDFVLDAMETWLETQNDGRARLMVTVVPRGSEFVGLILLADI